MFKTIKCTFVLQPLKWLNVALWKTWLNLCTCYFQSLPQLTRLSFRWKGIETAFKFSSWSMQICVFVSFSSRPLPIIFVLTLIFLFKIFIFLWQGHIFQIKLLWNVRIILLLLVMACLLFGCVSFQGAVSNTTHILLFSCSFINTS